MVVLSLPWRLMLRFRDCLTAQDLQLPAGRGGEWPLQGWEWNFAGCTSVVGPAVMSIPLEAREEF